MMRLPRQRGRLIGIVSLIPQDLIAEQPEPPAELPWSTALALRVDAHVAALIEAAEALLDLVEAGLGDPDDLTVLRARRAIDTGAIGLGSVCAQLLLGPPSVDP